MLHDKMSDLVFIKFNSKLKDKKLNKRKDPIEKQVVDVLEDVSTCYFCNSGQHGCLKINI